MRWLTHTISVLLLVSAAAVALTTVLSDHSDDYGQVPLPQGGVVELPKEKVTVFFHQLGDTSETREIGAPLSFRVFPAGGGEALPTFATNGEPAEAAVSRSETVGELGAVAKLKVPEAGQYVVSGSSDLPAGSSFLEFGTNSATAVVHKWKLLAGLLMAAFLVGFIPTPRSSRRWEDERNAPTGWSSDPRAPYAG